MINYNYLHYLYVKILQKLLGLMNKLHFPNKLRIKLIDYIEYYVDKKLEIYFDISSRSLNKRNEKNSKVIWLFWWQGKDNMPLLVKKCVNSIIKNSNEYKVIFIDKNNVHKYARLPNFMYEKLNKNYLSLTNFSDVLRMNLLRNYGGLWIDSTIFCSSKITDKYFDDLYTSSGYHRAMPRFVNGRWLSFLIGGNSNNEFFQFMDNFFQIYWKYNNYQLHYYMLDHGLHYAYKYNIGHFRDYAQKHLNSNPQLLNLITYINLPYNDKLYKKLFNDTNLFKLTYKINFIKKNNGKETFYYKIINDIL